MRTTLILLSMAIPVLAAEAPGQQAALSQKEIDAAVARGLDYLKVAPEPTAHGNYKNADGLILLTCLHGGMSEKNPFFQRLLERMLAAPLLKTYKVALQAMTLEELDRVKYQIRIAECAQFLVDNQTDRGNWHYGRKTDTTVNIKDIPSVASGSRKSDRGPVKLRRFRELRQKPKVVRKIRITQNRVITGNNYDNSNSQYAALGLRACWEAGIILPEQVIYKARQWWVESQHPPEDGGEVNAVASGGEARPRGWNYKAPGERGSPTPAMTAGAIGAVVIYDAMLKKNWKRDPVANSGVAWMAKKFRPSANNLYYMYAVERAGMLYQTDTFGTHDWYIEGAKVILKAQKGNGSWGTRAAGNKAQDVWKTCFAILFLKKATRMIATGGGN